MASSPFVYDSTRWQMFALWLRATSATSALRFFSFALCSCYIKREIENIVPAILSTVQQHKRKLLIGCHHSHKLVEIDATITVGVGAGN